MESLQTMAANGFQGYNIDRTMGSGPMDFEPTPADRGVDIGTLFADKKHEDLKIMLDSSKDNLKLEAMKRIIAMVAKGNDCSDLFPAVVKNVVSKNAEVKKLVYVYLTRYAEEQQDLALLSISTFQRALKDPNQLIRASALRVLSSIRVPVIVPIMMLAIKEAVMDMSPYVRKTAAHAIPKLYSLDAEQKDQLVEVIEKLLADKTVLVAGSAIHAFEEVCPERMELIHKHYRKLCSLLVDVEEWGQIVIINMLTRYLRSQFIDPNRTEMTTTENFYDDDSDEDSDDEDDSGSESGKNGTQKGKSATKVKPYVMDPDHRLLLRTCRPLLNSRNSAVMIAVVQLYYHCAPANEVAIAIKPMVRLLGAHKEIQFVVLSNIASMSASKPTLFENYLKSFYVRFSDATHIKLLKLEVLTNLANETSISTILREFQTYVTSPDKAFAAATVQAIGRCASNIPEITDMCLNGLVLLLSKRDESVVAESVVVIKKLLQMQSSDHKDIIVHMARLADSIQVPMARASILWLIGEYCDRIPKIAPDVLRKMAKNFVNEEDIVKLQVLNLAAKLCISNSKQTKLLTQYVFNLAKYDQNYDIRDRSRFLRALILPSDECAGGYLAKHAKKIFLATKPAPLLESTFKDRPNYQLGSLSHLLNKQCTGYQPLPTWPQVAPDASVREVPAEPTSWGTTQTLLAKPSTGKSRGRGKGSSNFYTSSEEEEEEESEEDSEEDSEEESDEEESSEEESSEEESEESSDEEPRETLAKKAARFKATIEPAKTAKKIVKLSSDEDEEEDENSSEVEDSSSQTESDDEEETSSESEEEPPRRKATSKPPPPPPEPAPKKAAKSKKGASNKTEKPSADLLLLDFGDDPVTSSAPIPAPLLPETSSLLTPTAAKSGDSSTAAVPAPKAAEAPLVASTVSGKSYELVNRYTSNGLNITYRYPRSISVFSPRLINVELQLVNESEQPIERIRIVKKPNVQCELQEFPEIAVLGPHATSSVLMSVDLKDSSQPVPFHLCIGQDLKLNVAVRAPVGELVRPVTMTEREFSTTRSRLSGMNEHTINLDLSGKRVDARSLATCILQTANVLPVPSPSDVPDSQRFAGRSVANEHPVLVSLDGPLPKLRIGVNCESMTIGSMLLQEVKEAINSNF